MEGEVEVGDSSFPSSGTLEPFLVFTFPFFGFELKAGLQEAQSPGKHTKP